ncbi:MAG: FapA family protein [Spirochaetota bacterium]|nr:FapA family protein [Spirochaetota bacterium]
MKLILFYIDPQVNNMFVEKVNDEGEKKVILSSSYNFVYKNEIIAKIIDVKTKDDINLHIDKGHIYYHVEQYIPFKAERGVYYDKTSMAYRASEYGFAVFNRNLSQLLLHSPLRFTKDKVKAFFIIHPTKFNKIPNYSEIEIVLTKKKILAKLEKEAIENQLKKIDTNSQKANQIIIALGKEPENGYDEYYIPIIELNKKSGKVLENGSIDFKEIESIQEVKKHQEILRRIPEKKPVDGYNVYNEKIKGIIENKGGYKKGKNILQSTDELIYVSAIDGCLEIYKNEISVSPIVIVKGDVDYESGNIDFNGSVEIWGSILPGFSVKARDNIIVEMNIDDSIIEAGGDILVKSGISGKGSTKLSAGGKVQAKYIINSTIEAGGDVEVEDSIINSNIISNNRVRVTNKRGKIIGGSISAMHEIIVNESGVPQENKTILSVGKSILVEREIIDIAMEKNSTKAEVDELTGYIKSLFGEELFKNPQKMMQGLPPERRKSCIQLLSKLSDCNKRLEKLNKEYEDIEKKRKPEYEPTITISDTVYPGTIININKRKKIIHEKLVNVQFFEDLENKEICYSSII